MSGPGAGWNQGAVYVNGRQCRFRVWAPRAARVELHLLDPRDCLVTLEAVENGRFEATLDNVEPGARYFYRIDGGRDRPDPASRFQPEGVHGPSQVVASQFQWGDGDWRGLPLQQYVLYELHVGVFTPDGTFEAIIPHLDYLRTLGITVVELMPVAQFPGDRNWGYDGVCPFAVQNSYGGPEGLKKLVNACHERGLGVALDVVYNHLGPEGNYLDEFGPYFTDRYRTPWGRALNFDGPDCDQVRRFFVDNGLYWVTEFHIDALRLDAVHAIFDQSARPFLEELGEAIHQQADRLGRRVHVIPESALNDTRLIRSQDAGGFGLDAQWNDDFHHALHTLVTGERAGYYEDFGELHHLVKAYREGFVYSGQYSPFRRRRHGNSSARIPARQFVVFSQNHDHVGNRLRGERLGVLAPFESLKLAAAAVLLSPYIPLLFMGEEYAETAPFLYFVSHSDRELIEAVRRGRREEFDSFAWQGESPDPQAVETFLRSKLHLPLRDEGPHRTLCEFYEKLLSLRRDLPALAFLGKDHMEVTGLESQRVLLVRRWYEGDEVCCILSFGAAPAVVNLTVPAGRWRKLLDSAEPCWRGGGSSLPHLLETEGAAALTLASQAIVLYRREPGGQGEGSR